MPSFIGFDPGETAKLQQALGDARLCLDSALREAFDDNDRFQTRLTKYFGKDEYEFDSHAIMKAINSMKLVVDSGVYLVKRGGDKGNTSAEASHLKQQMINFGGTAARQVRTARLQGTSVYEGKRVNVVEAIMDYASNYGAAPIEIFDQYFALPYKSLDAQSQVQVFIHELSHMAAGTVDVDPPACYEWSGVQYCIANGKAPANAENYGMFLQSYIT